MKHSIAKTTFVAVIVAISATGCSMKAAQKQAAVIKWEKTLEEARFTGAREYIELGQFDQARLMLKPLADANNPRALEIINSINQPRQTRYAVAPTMANTEKAY